MVKPGIGSTGSIAKSIERFDSLTTDTNNGTGRVSKPEGSETGGYRHSISDRHLSAFKRRMKNATN
jgi:hypothetical protein